MAEVLEGVPEGVRDLAAGREDVSVVPVNKDLAAAAGGPVDRVGNADAQALHAAGEALGAFCLDEQVQVISLHREVHDADAEPLLSFADRGEDCLEQSPSPQITRRQAAPAASRGPDSEIGSLAAGDARHPAWCHSACALRGVACRPKSVT